MTGGEVPAGEVLLAHPVAVLAIPAFIPVVVIVATILWVARKDRREAAAEAAALETVDVEPALVGPTPTEATADETAALDDPEPRRSWRARLPRLVIGDEE